MRLGFAFIIACLLGVTVASAAADVESRLAGEWHGDKLSMVIDSERGQARLSPDKPFQWDRFIVKSIAGSQVVFTVGVRLFVATLEGDTLSVEAVGFQGPQLLRRQSEAPVSASSELRGTDSSGLTGTATQQ